MSEEAKGNIFYGLHFYPGLAQYQDPEDKEPYRVFLNEETLRAMDPTFAGRPVFVLHVDEVETDINELRKEADGWVVESFFNAADGKHWAKFLVVSDKGNNAIRQGLKLSNCYIPKHFGPGGTWNGIDYQKQITDAVYEHLAIVPNPRYEESVIMTPEEFKSYNEEQILELKKLSNSKKEGEGKMKLSFFKRAKVDNSADIEAMSVLLPNSHKEVSITKLINDADKEEMEKEKPKIAEMHHLVDCNGKTMTVNDLVMAHKKMCDEMEVMKKPKEEDHEEMKDDDEDDSDPAAMNDEPEDQDMEYAREKPVMPEDDKRAEKSALRLEEHEEREVKDAKKKNAREKAERLRNANHNAAWDVPTIELPNDQVARGKSRYGSQS